MKKNDEKMKKILMAQLKQEADDIIAEVEDDESLKDISMPDDMDEKLMNMIQEYEDGQEVYERLSEKDKEALRLGREMQMLREMGEDEDDAGDEHGGENGAQNENLVARGTDDTEKKVVRYRRKKKLRKVYVLVAVVTVLVLAVGMTSIGGAPFLTDMWKNAVGDREIVKVNTERENEGTVEKGTNSEVTIYEEVKKEMGVDVVRLLYVPEDTKLLTSDINKTSKTVCLLFQCKGNVIEYQIILNYNQQVYGYDVEDKLLDEKEVEVSGIPVKIKQYEIKGKGKEFVAQFEYQNAFYIINAAISEEEFMKIVKNLFFY